MQYEACEDYHEGCQCLGCEETREEIALREIADDNAYWLWNEEQKNRGKDKR